MDVTLFHFIYNFIWSFDLVHPNACAVWCLPLHGSRFTQWSPGTLLKSHIGVLVSLLDLSLFKTRS